MKFSLLFLGYHDKEAVPKDNADRVRHVLCVNMQHALVLRKDFLRRGATGCRMLQVEWMFSQPATLELTHNWGTENDDHYKNSTGNEDPKGYGTSRMPCISEPRRGCLHCCMHSST